MCYFARSTLEREVWFRFFVLSGFLIAMVLDKENTLSASVIYDFYYKRIKRIVPMYLLVILVTLALSLLVFPQSNLAVNVKSATVALLFLSNVSPLSKESNEYYSMVSGFEIVYSAEKVCTCRLLDMVYTILGQSAVST